MKITAQLGNACFSSLAAQAVVHIKTRLPCYSTLELQFLPGIVIWLFAAASTCKVKVYWSKHSPLLSSLRQVQNTWMVSKFSIVALQGGFRAVPLLVKYYFGTLIVYIPKMYGLISKWHFSSFFLANSTFPCPGRIDSKFLKVTASQWLYFLCNHMHSFYIRKINYTQLC